MVGSTSGLGSIAASNLSILWRILTTGTPLENLPLGVPVGQRKQQPLKIGIAGKQLRLDGGDFAAAAIDFDS